jgi:hypothetical protein
MRLELGLYRINHEEAHWALKQTYIEILKYDEKKGGKYTYRYVPDITKFGTSIRSADQLEHCLIPLSSLEKELI